MRSFLRVFPNQFFADLAILGLIVGLVTSKVVLSVATIMLMCNAFINIRAGQNMKTWLRDPVALWCLAVFGMYLISGFWSGDLGYWVDRCRMKLPFLALPLGFVAVKRLSKEAFHRWLAIYVWVIAGTSCIVLLNYLLHFKELNEALTYGHPIPAPLRDHIRFSLELAFAIVVAGYLFVQRVKIFTGNRPYIYAILSLFMVICIHVFAVRSGIITLYAALFIVLIHQAFSRKKYLQALAGMGLVAIVAYASMVFIPSLHARMGYFAYELELIRKGQINPEHSDAQRLLSMQYGITVAQESPIIGVGAGDIRDKMVAQYALHTQSDIVKSKMPHNQYIYFFAATGIIGVLIFIISALYPWFSRGRYKNLLYTVFLSMMMISFMAEHTLEIQLGTAYYLLFLLLIRKYIDDNSTPVHA